MTEQDIGILIFIIIIISIIGLSIFGIIMDSKNNMTSELPINRTEFHLPAVPTISIPSEIQAKLNAGKNILCYIKDNLLYYTDKHFDIQSTTDLNYLDDCERL